MPLIQRKLDGFVLWFFSNKDSLEAQERGRACPSHEKPEDCPTHQLPGHSCPFDATGNKNSAAAADALEWTADECSEAGARVDGFTTEASGTL